MPTSRPRHTITETDRVACALDAAAKRWPSESRNRSKLLLRLLEEGHRAVQEQREDTASNRREAVERTSGTLTGMFGPNYLDELREDWPE